MSRERRLWTMRMTRVFGQFMHAAMPRCSGLKHGRITSFLCHDSHNIHTAVLGSNCRQCSILRYGPHVKDAASISTKCITPNKCTEQTNWSHEQLCDIFNLRFIIFQCHTHYRASSVSCENSVNFALQYSIASNNLLSFRNRSKM